MTKNIGLDYYYYADDADHTRMKIEIDLENNTARKRAKYEVEWGAAFDLDDDGEGEMSKGYFDHAVFDQLYKETAALNIKKDIVGKANYPAEETEGGFLLVIRDKTRYVYYSLGLIEETVRKSRGIEKIYTIVKTILDISRCKVENNAVIPIFENDEERKEGFIRRINFSFDYEGSHCNIQLFYENENRFSCKTFAYTRDKIGVCAFSHDTEETAEGGDYEELVEQLTNLNVNELMSDNIKDDYQQGLRLYFDLYDQFGSLCFTFENVNKDNKKERKLETLCSVAERMIELSSLRDTEFYKAIKVISSGSSVKKK